LLENKIAAAAASSKIADIVSPHKQLSVQHLDVEHQNAPDQQR
jgi:hypothetical protein